MSWANETLQDLVADLNVDEGTTIGACGKDVIETFQQAARNLSNDGLRLSACEKLDALIKNAHEKMSTSRQVAPCWQCLYTDACLLRSLSDIGSLDEQSEDIALDAIARLDRAIIIAGASGQGRLDLIHRVIKKTQSDHIPVPQLTASVLLPHADVVPITLATSSQNIIELVSWPSLPAFQSQLSRAPFILRGFINDWPAIHEDSWQSVDYLRLIAGPGRIVPVEVGKDYRMDDWTQKLMPWDDFLATISRTCKQKLPDEVLYLAQHNLLTQFPALRNDIRIPDYAYAYLAAPEDFPAYKPPGNDEQLIINVWLGPKGTVSPAHTDPFYNLYAQVVGRKTVWLASPKFSASMYPYSFSSSQPNAEQPHNPGTNTSNPSMCNTSRVDVFPSYDTETKSREAHPDFWANVVPNAISATLEPGDLLFFPPGWWHAMRSEDTSFSVSMWV